MEIWENEGDILARFWIQGQTSQPEPRKLRGIPPLSLASELGSRRHGWVHAKTLKLLDSQAHMKDGKLNSFYTSPWGVLPAFSKQPLLADMAWSNLLLGYHTVIDTWANHLPHILSQKLCCFKTHSACCHEWTLRKIQPESQVTRSTHCEGMSQFLTQ